MGGGCSGGAVCPTYAAHPKQRDYARRRQLTMGDAEIMAGLSAAWAEPDDGEDAAHAARCRCPDCQYARAQRTCRKARGPAMSMKSQLVIRVPADLEARLLARANTYGCSLGALVRTMLINACPAESGPNTGSANGNDDTPVTPPRASQ